MPSARSPLTRDTIVAAALDLIDADGVDGLTMRKLGNALGVEAMSLYHHVENKDDLFDRVADHLLGMVEVPEGIEGWRDQLMALALAFRRVGLAHPEAFRLVSTRPRRTLDSWTPLLAAWRVLRAEGLDVGAAADAFTALAGFVVGSVLNEAGGESRRREEPIADCGTAPSPDLAEFIEYQTDPAELFGRSVGLVLDGIATRIG